MEFLGTVVGITSEGNLTVKCDSVPEIGDLVFDDARRQIGRVRKLMGPVDSPYASVTASSRDARSGSRLYFGKGKSQRPKYKRRARGTGRCFSDTGK